MKTLALLAPAMLIAAPAAAQVMTPAQYVSTAGASDLYEITSSKLVLQTTQDPKIRSFAQMMVMEHTKSTAQVKAAAARARVKAAPAKLNPLQTELVSELRSESGAARDARYIAQQKAAHNQALEVQKAYAMEGTSAPLKAAAAGIVPVVQQHVDMLKSM
ncbi:putative membrane protein [Sphingomonas gellani]|uniref:Putative membrane protein n=1 Tax=Sphingomonas gellani TaxID=1166340 RepID=A0A1H8G6B6_9SPHN|nr:DUF4142 domain-containing protein [Sphingomonas gellani]SEN39533.1 putative membrane protein [Sphingomonas gellani]